MTRAWSDRILLRTTHLVLEPIEERHAELVFAGLSDARLYEYIPMRAPASVDELKEKFRLVSAGASRSGDEEWMNWAVRLSDGPYVGRVEATLDRSGVASIAYIIFAPLWRRGFGKEGVRAMLDYLRCERGIYVFRAEIDRRNSASIALVRSLGFAKADLTEPEAVCLDAADDLYELSVGAEHAPERQPSAEATVCTPPAAANQDHEAE